MPEFPYNPFRAVSDTGRRRRTRRLSVRRLDYLARKESARALVHERLGYFVRTYAALHPSYGDTLRYARVTIRMQRSRWGSCSSNRSLSFNYRLLDLAPELRDYIIVHELCHLKELNHGLAFWELIELIFPDARMLNRKVRKLRTDA